MKWGSLILRGVTADRPASGTLPEGALYYSTDDEETTRQGASSWESFSGSGGSPTNADGCSLYLSANVSIPNATNTTIPFDAEYYDHGDLHDNGTNPERVTVTTAGRYLSICHMQSSGYTDTVWYAEFLVNGTDYRERVIGNSVNISPGDLPTLAAILNLDAGDYIEIVVYQASGGSLNMISNPDANTIWTTIKLANTP